ncbi:urease accessory protein UreD [Noviherbaspirillum cavernae]|uniref:Urease accessory protein UreD n=1 Tax=Noviherbaspirillum cavernae TaxID=2320862 RepID=A0A418WZ31_9BURK|nr:urease accessory protein UreD [Noviherbaspirillum cavernae]RJG05476.1 urease accessory protein UreD [Noviherbaspirillum cavernae]
MKRIAQEPVDQLPVDDAAASTRWKARLSLGFADDAGTTRLVERSHFGPLRVQKPLYPEGSDICHAIVIHPPGGVVGGDELTITANVGAHAHAFITTPGAAKWYKANGSVSHQKVRLDVAQGASLEWLPQETIFFNAAHVRLDQHISLERDASYIGCEVLCFGRTASGEIFDTGRIEQRTSIRYDSKLIWFEQGALGGDEASMHSPLALAGKTVCATLIAAGKVLPASVIAGIRDEAMSNGDLFGATQLKSVLVVRYLGTSSETAKQLMTRAWHRIRPELMGREAVVPRIWNT